MSGPAIRTGSQILVLALLALASSVAMAEAKVIWNGSTVHGSGGGRHASPLDRAESLAWRQNFIVRSPVYPFVPPLATPFGPWAPFVQTGWMWSNYPLGGFAPFCGGW
jgi:hypothetical protein